MERPCFPEVRLIHSRRWELRELAPATFSRCVSPSSSLTSKLHLVTQTFNTRIQYNGYRRSFATVYPYSQPRPQLAPSLLSYLPYTSSTLYSFHFLLGYGCFSQVCPALPSIQGVDLTPLSEEPCSMTMRPFREGEVMTLRVITITSPSNFPPPPNPTRSPAKRQHPSHGPTRPKLHWAHA